MERENLSHEKILETLLELKGYRENRELFKKHQATPETPGFKAEELLQILANNGAIYDQILSTPEEIEELFGKYMREKFDKNLF